MVLHIVGIIVLGGIMIRCIVGIINDDWEYWITPPKMREEKRRKEMEEEDYYWEHVG